MNEIISFGLSDDTIKSMISINPGIMIITDEEVKEKVYLLENIGCSYRQVRNIISSNPLYFEALNRDVIGLFDELKKIGFSSLSDLIESNPNILNLDKHDIDYYVNSKVSEGLSLEDIVDELESDSFLFNEI